MINPLAYELSQYGTAETVVVVGIQVGRFAVRMLEPDEDRVDAAGEYMPRVGDFVVEHILSGWSMGEYATLSRALRVADELSAHALHDPTSENTESVDELDAQIGYLQSVWLNNFFKCHTELGFREWREQYLEQQAAERAAGETSV